jgi:hypothetical protein
MKRITAMTYRNSYCNSSGGYVLQRTGAIETFRLHAVHDPRTSTNSCNFVLPLSALPDQRTGHWMASADLLSAESLYGENSHEPN